MSLLRSFHMLTLAAGLALTASGASWAQEATEAAPEAGTVVPADEVAPEIAVEGDVLVTEDGAVPVDALGATPEEVEEGGTPDASGNMNEDRAPGFDVVDAATVDEPQIGADLPIIGQPRPAGLGFQPAASTIADDTQWLANMVDVIILLIAIFVSLLLVWVIYRFNERKNATPARFTHNSPLEIAWTIVPIIILVFIGAFSLPVLFEQQEIPEGDVHIKVTGYQWFWNYEYPDEGIAFDSYMIGYGQGNLNPEISADLQEAGFTDEQFKLATDTYVVVPVGATVVMTVTGGDVIHSWTVPSFGVKQDAVPGRLAHLWFTPTEEGIFFGQCSELCGKDHAFMPIQVRVVSPEAYEAWLAENRPAEAAPAG